MNFDAGLSLSLLDRPDANPQVNRLPRDGYELSFSHPRAPHESLAWRLP